MRNCSGEILPVIWKDGTKGAVAWCRAPLDQSERFCQIRSKLMTELSAHSVVRSFPQPILKSVGDLNSDRTPG